MLLYLNRFFSFSFSLSLKQHNYIFINTLVDRWKRNFFFFNNRHPVLARHYEMSWGILIYTFSSTTQIQFTFSAFSLFHFFLLLESFSSFNLHCDEIKNQQSFWVWLWRFWMCNWIKKKQWNGDLWWLGNELKKFSYFSVSGQSKPVVLLIIWHQLE